MEPPDPVAVLDDYNTANTNPPWQQKNELPNFIIKTTQNHSAAILQKWHKRRYNPQLQPPLYSYGQHNQIQSSRNSLNPDKFQEKQCEAEAGPAFFLGLLIDFHVVINQALDATLCCFQNLTIHLHLILHPPIQ